MQNIIIELAQYIIILCMALYTYHSFSYFTKKTDASRRRVAARLNFCLFFVHFLANLVAWLITGNEVLILLYGGQVVYFIVTIFFYQLAYPNSSNILVSHMCMLLNIGLIMITRLSFYLAVKQFLIVAAGTLAAAVIPLIMKKCKLLRKMAWVYGGVGVLLLLIVALTAKTTNGAKLFLFIGPFSFQPSEFVKIIYVFFLSAMLEHKSDFKQVVKAGIMAAAHILILVFSKDLGGALIFAIVFVVMVYVATGKTVYLFGGLLGGSFAAYLAWYLFDHVKTRVTAWIDPWSVIDGKGYQISQSLFAIGTGSWFGSGLYEGSPGQIPVVEQDFIFSAIAEELGGITAVCIILICLGSLLLFLNIALEANGRFYCFMALGLAAVYGTQVFLTIGGALKFIPSTGVTLPLISYGGSSVLSTLVMFAIVQGLYILRRDEGGVNEKNTKRKRD